MTPEAQEQVRTVLVLFATREGQTEKIARKIAEHLELAGLNTQVVNARNGRAIAALNPGGFDLLVFGASMHAGGLEPEIVSYLNSHTDEIDAKPRSFFLVLLSAATKKRTLRETWLADAQQKLSQQLNLKFEDTELIGGALKYSRYSWPMKWLMRRIARQSGGDTDTTQDYEYTDWEQVRQYSQRLSSLIG